MIQDTARDIRAVCNEIAELLVKKNESYGDSALNPINCFAKDATVLEKLGVRIDDKLSRVLRGTEAFNEDTELDLLGYLVLRRIYLTRVKIEHAAASQSQGSGGLIDGEPAEKHLGQGQEAEEEEDNINRTQPAPPASARFIKPTATTAKAILAKEQSTRESYGEHH